MGNSTLHYEWGYHWRSSPWFIVSAMAIALFTDTFLYSFLNPILPYVIESRLGLDASYTQTASSWLLAESAGVCVLVSIPFGHNMDKSASKRSFLLWALVISLISTVSIALSTSLFALFAGRFVQAIGTSMIWVVGLSIVADKTPIQHVGKTYSLISMTVAVGTSVGPMLSGILFQLSGYWTAWVSAFAILLLDIILRLLMLERHGENEREDTSNNAEPNSEQSPLLGNQHNEARPAPNFYKALFLKPNFSGGIFCCLTFATMLTAFNATLPLHVRDVFHWGTMSSGLMFGLLQAPPLVMSPVVGWLKDRMGTRDPTVFGFVLLVPLICLLGVPGNDSFPWFNVGNRGSITYVVVMASVGLISSFLNGSGTIEAAVAVSELENDYPGAFGSNGGKSRALSIASTFWTLGTCVGPLLAGYLVEQAGYFNMNCVVAGLLAVSAVVAFLCLRSKPTYTLI